MHSETLLDKIKCSFVNIYQLEIASRLGMGASHVPTSLSFGTSSGPTTAGSVHAASFSVRSYEPSS